MKWEALGADKETGSDKSLVIEADTEDSARRRANRRGLMVSTVRPLDEPHQIVTAARVEPPVLPPTQSQAPTIVYVIPPPMMGPMQHPQQGPGIVTIQATGKVWKAQIALSALLMIGGIVVCALAFNKVVKFEPGLFASASMFVVGLVWYVFAKIGAWWFHG